MTGNELVSALEGNTAAVAAAAGAGTPADASQTAAEALEATPAGEGEDTLARAHTLGFPTSTEPLEVSAKAAGLLDAHASGIGVSLTLRTLTVAVDHIPTPAEFASFERSSGCEVSICIVPTPVLEQMRTQADKARRERNTIWTTLAQVADSGAEEAWLVPGQPLMVGDINGWKASSDTVTSAAELHDVLAEIRSQDDTVCRTFGNNRWRITTVGTATAPSLHIRRLPLQIPRVDELGIPSPIINLTAREHGVIIVTGPAGSGRSTVALSLASRGSVTRQRPLAVTSAAPERLPTAAGGPVWFTPADTDSHTIATTRSVVVMDDLNFTAQDWSQAARAGNLVIAVAWDDDITHVAAQPALADTLLAVLGVQRLPSPKGPRLIYTTLIANQAIRAAVRNGDSAHVHAIGTAAGRSVYQPLHTALAAEVESGTLDEKVAFNAVVDDHELRQALQAMRTQATGTSKVGKRRRERL